MAINYNFLFYYLEKEDIFIDKEEFILQIQLHPDYHSLLSIADTLSFFNIENGAIRIDFTDVVIWVLLEVMMFSFLKNNVKNHLSLQIKTLNFGIK
jgi:hypothetical protein